MFSGFFDVGFLQKQHSYIWSSINPCLMRLLPDATNQLEMSAYCGYFTSYLYSEYNKKNDEKTSKVLSIFNETIIGATIDGLLERRASMPPSFPSKKSLVEAMQFAIKTRYPEYHDDMLSGDPYSSLKPWCAAAKRHLSHQSENNNRLAMPIEQAAIELANATRASITVVEDIFLKRFR